jgi:hypothetical protein
MDSNHLGELRDVREPVGTGRIDGIFQQRFTFTFREVGEMAVEGVYSC